jgi:hypothetical protein
MKVGGRSVNTSTVFTLAILAGLADLVAILTWLRIKPQQVFSADWWRVHQVTITGGKVFLNVDACRG